MKLYKLLFEETSTKTISHDEIIAAILQMLRTNSDTSKYIHSFLDIVTNEDTPNKSLALAENFYKETKPQWDNILKTAETIKHLKGGSKGNAFDLGNQILKLELETPWDTRFSSKRRAETAATALFGKPSKDDKQSPSQQITRKLNEPHQSKTLKENKKENIGSAVPMIYDQGTMKYPNAPGGQEISWTIMEKFETLKRKPEYFLGELLDAINTQFADGYPPEEVKQENNLDAQQKQYVIDLSHILRLKDNWFETLVQHMWNLKQQGISDFHAGNIGIRRSGGEGSLVFFD